MASQALENPSYIDWQIDKSTVDCESVGSSKINSGTPRRLIGHLAAKPT